MKKREEPPSMIDRIREQRLAEILARATQSCPDCVGSALTEGLPPLARIALTARIARRAQRLFSFRVDSARLVIDSAIRAAEKAASGDALTTKEDLAAWDATVLRACEVEMLEGNKADAEAGYVARRTARCVYGPEFAYGENALLARNDLWQIVYVAQEGSLERTRRKAAAEEDTAVHADLEKLILFVEAFGEHWRDPELHKARETFYDPHWLRMLEETGVGVERRSAGENAERWRRIHTALRQKKCVFYPPDLFGSI